MIAKRISSQARTDCQVRVDLLARAKGRYQRNGARVLTEDGDGVVNVRTVPDQKLRHALERQTGRALDIAMRHAAPGGPKDACKGGAQGARPFVKRPRPNEDLPEPLVADALSLERAGEEVAQVGVSRVTQDPRAWCQARGSARLCGWRTWPAWAAQQEVFLGRSRSSRRRSSQSARRFATSAAAPKPRGTGDSKSFPKRLQTLNATKTSTGGRCAGDTLNGDEQGARGFVDGGANMLVREVPHEARDARESFARALACCTSCNRHV